jgi:hypothetical protein
MLLLGDGCRTLLAHPWAVRWAAAGGNDDGGDAERGALLEEAMSGCVTTQRGQRGVRGAGGEGGAHGLAGTHLGLGCVYVVSND